MSFELRTQAPILAAAVLFAFTLPARAAAIDDTIPDQQGMAQLELRASQAKPREQCYLYTQLVHVMTEKAGKEIGAGDTEHANATLRQIDVYAHIIQNNVVKDAKGLKEAEMLMRHTTFRLAQFLHLVPEEDKQTVQATLKQLDQVNAQLLNQVLKY